MTKYFYLILAFIAMTTITQANDYCKPPRYTSGPYTGINRVTLEQIDKSSNFYDGYADFTSSGKAELAPGSTYTISFEFYYDPSMLSYFAGNIALRVWIDWNKDFDFTDPGEEVVAKLVSCAGSTSENPVTKYTATFTVPAKAATGKTRMRVYEDMPESDGHDKPNPCGYLNSGNGIGQHGECEDYTVQVGASAPQPKIQIENDFIEFEPIGENDSKSLDLNVSNIGDADLNISGFELLNNTDNGFSFGKVNYPVKIAPGKSFVLPIAFNPKQAGDFSAELNVMSNDPDVPVSNVTLTGSAYTVKPEISMSSFNIIFGKKDKAATDSILIKNLGNGPLNLTDVKVNSPEGVFTLKNPEFSKSLKPSDEVLVYVQFAPAENKTYSGSLTFRTDDPANINITVKLQGIGQGLTSVDEHAAEGMNIEILSNSLIEISGYEGQGIKKLQVYSIGGFCVLETEIRESIDLNGLSAGVYFLKIGNKVHKFIKF